MPEYCNLCPSRLERDIYLRRALDNIENKRRKNHTWKDKEYNELFSEIINESRSLLCSGYLTYLGHANVISPIHGKKIVIEQPRQANLEHALREATKKILEPAIIIFIKENGNYCGTLGLRSESQWKIYDFQENKALEIKDLDPGSVNEIQIVTTVKKELRFLYKHCGKHLCAKEQSNDENLSLFEGRWAN